MDEHGLHEVIDQVKTGHLSRRAFIRAMTALGLTAPMAAGMLAPASGAHAQTQSSFTPTRRGGGGPLRVLWWQAPTLLNPHFGTGTKDLDGSRIFYEPLAAYDPDGNLVPILADRIPTFANGDLGRDGTWVVWQLKRGVQWHDGKPFTADDIVFNWEYAADPATAGVWIQSYRDIDRVERLHDHAVKLVFKNPTPFWFNAFCSDRAILPKHLFAPYKGAKSRNAPTNLRPVGTGPYRFVDFKPGDIVRAELNPQYHMANRPFFDTLEMKGGGDAVSAARAVLQTGEFDYAWNILVEDDVLRRLEQVGKGRVEIVPMSAVEHIQCNFTDPWKEVEGERSSVKTTHPILSDPAVRQALNLLVDRSAVQEQIYGRQGQATANFLNSPERFRSQNMKWEFNPDRVNHLLDAAGWKRGSDEIRAKDGKRLRFVYQTSINAPRQKTQAIVKHACAKAGIDVELKSVWASVYFSSDGANVDTYSHFSTDLQMYASSIGIDPQLGMRQFVSWEISAKENKWAGRNITRWRSDEYDRIYKSAENEMDPVKRAAKFIRMNDLLIENVVVIPIVWRKRVNAASTRLRGTALSGWDSSLWNLANWHKA
jgi:peptide/nickel transport system substrate-binding protein